MRVCGVMSGTSLDGVDVAIVDIARGKVQPVAFHSVPYAKGVREAILGVSNSMTHTAAISRLHVLLGELYAEAIRETCRRKRIARSSIELCGIHGQTIFHESQPTELLGRKITSTFQIGDPAVVAERTGLRVVSNFRERDMAAGGNGAPLVPYVDYLLFRDRRACRVALNIGGIANITVIGRAAKPEQAIAFDTGPGNMVIDALVRKLTAGKKSYDADGKIGRDGQVHAKLLDSMLADPYFAQAPPKSTGREQFGEGFVSGLLATGISVPDLIATATELTAQSIAQSILRSIGNAVPRSSRGPRTNVQWEVIASGGGVHNPFLMDRLAALLPGLRIVTSAAFGIDPDAKEAIAFAVLAHELIRGRPANLPSATGARRRVLLGRLTPA